MAGNAELNPSFALLKSHRCVVESDQSRPVGWIFLGDGPRMDGLPEQPEWMGVINEDGRT